MQLTALTYDKRGRRYPLYFADGTYFIHDPNFELQHERASVRRHLQATARLPARGLGVVPAGVFQAVGTAASFIPVVGPFLGPLIQAAGALFGGGDPTALSILMGQIVQLRARIADANNMLGHPDPFTVPSGFDPTNKDASRDIVDSIVEQVLGVTEEQIQGNRRADYYSAIDALNKLLTQAQSSEHDAALVATIQASLAPRPSATSPTTAPAAATAAPATSNLPLLALGLGAILALSQL